MAINAIITMIVKDKTIPQQEARMKIMYPQFAVTTTTSSMVVKGSVRPTARSVPYSFCIVFWLNNLPVITISNPQLVRNKKGDKIPHMYEQKSLCLFRPKYRQFKLSDLIADTIVPWTSLWLLHYENWHLTGEWQGGGEHPNGRINW